MKILTEIKDRAVRFIRDDDGADLLEICAGIVFALVLIVVVHGIITNVSNTMDTAGEKVNEEFKEAMSINPSTTP